MLVPRLQLHAGIRVKSECRVFQIESLGVAGCWGTRGDTEVASERGADWHWCCGSGGGRSRAPAAAPGGGRGLGRLCSLLCPGAEAADPRAGGQGSVNLRVCPPPPLWSSGADLPVSRGLPTLPRTRLHPRRKQTSFKGLGSYAGVEK